VFIIMLMVRSMMDNGGMIRDMVMGYFITQRKRSMMVNG
jgi:hypothetical protein